MHSATGPLDRPPPVSHGERLDHIDQRLDRIEAGQGDPAQRIAHLEGREEALTAT